MTMVLMRQFHFVLVPLMAQGHMIPMIDMARLITERGVTVTIVTTPRNASRFETIIHRARSCSNLPIRVQQLHFPCEEVGLPHGYENLDTLTSPDLLKNFYVAIAKLQEPFEQFLDQAKPCPSCIISDKCLSWTKETAERFNIPHIVFHGMGSFSLLSAHNIRLHKPHLSVDSDVEPFLVPGMPIGYKVTRSQLPGSFISIPDLDDVRNRMHEAEATAFGVVVNTFEELEHGCAQEYRKALNKNVWCVGPVSLCNTERQDMFERGNKASVDEKHCLIWLDLMKPRSVIYVCLGSLCRLVPSQLIELGLGLEASNQPFIWVVKTGEERINELEEWLVNENFEERIKGRGLLIKGWAPQLLILSHPSVGGFLTHCGWNSTLEAICSRMPMITWPLFAEQFLNEKLIVEILKIGIRIGVDVPVRWGDEEKVGVLVKKEQVVKAINMLMDCGEEGVGRRKRARELGEIASKAMLFNGSSYNNITRMIEDVMRQRFN